jgi:hypothetical protein
VVKNRLVINYKKSITGWTELGGLDKFAETIVKHSERNKTWYGNQQSPSWPHEKSVFVLRKLWLFGYPVVPVKSLA